jgi:hypothetical protein
MAKKQYIFTKSLPAQIGWWWIKTSEKKAAVLFKLKPTENGILAREPYSHDVKTLKPKPEWTFCKGKSPEPLTKMEAEEFWKE